MPTDKSKSVGVRLRHDTIRALRFKAAARKQSLGKYLRALLERHARKA